MEVTVIRVCATMHAGSTATGPSRASFAWNGRMGAGKILYESQRMKNLSKKDAEGRAHGWCRQKIKGYLHVQQSREEMSGKRRVKRSNPTCLYTRFRGVCLGSGGRATEGL